MTKRYLCKSIMRNMLWLLSKQFWRGSLIDRDFPFWGMIYMMVVVGLIDIVKMILMPNYPEEKAA